MRACYRDNVAARISVSNAKPHLRGRIAVCAGITVASGLFCYMLLRHLGVGAYDFTWALYPARELLAGRNPYGHLPTGGIGYPMTAIVLALPFTRLSDPAAAGVFFGISSGILALGLTKHGYQRLLVFLAYPYWAGLLTAQWAPLIMASALLPPLLPLSAAKPQIGLPVFLTRMTKRGAISCAAFVAATFIIRPTWFKNWISQALSYQHFFPLLVFPGPFLLLALVKYRKRGAWLLLLLASTPQRWFYDAFVLWLIPRSRREILFTALASWGAGIWRWYHFPHSFNQVGRWAVIFLYLPMLAVVLMKSSPEAEDGQTVGGALPAASREPKLLLGGDDPHMRT